MEEVGTDDDGGLDTRGAGAGTGSNNLRYTHNSFRYAGLDLGRRRMALGPNLSSEEDSIDDGSGGEDTDGDTDEEEF